MKYIIQKSVNAEEAAIEKEPTAPIESVYVDSKNA